jgi:hypothetical protein
LSLIKAVTPKKRDINESTADVSDSDLAACLNDDDDSKKIFNTQAVTNFILVYASQGRLTKTLMKLYKLIGINNAPLPNFKFTLSSHICSDNKGSLSYLLFQAKLDAAYYAYYSDILPITEKTDPVLAALVRSLYKSLIDDDFKTSCKLFQKLKGKQIHNTLEN